VTWAETSRRLCLVANRDTLPQKCPPPPWNVAESCELSVTTNTVKQGEELDTWRRRTGAKAVAQDIQATHPRVHARQSKISIPRIRRGIDVRSQFPPPSTLSMAPAAEPNCSSKNLGWLSKPEQQERVSVLLPEARFKPRPEQGLDCLIRAEFSRQRELDIAVRVDSLTGYLARKKLPPPRTPQQDCA